MSRFFANKNRNQSLLQLLLLLGVLILVNILGNIFYTHFDLTEEKRFTLTDPTVELLHSLDEPVFVRVLLEGEFPAGFRRLQRASREMLDDFRSESKSFHADENRSWFRSLGNFFGGDALLEYEYSNPSEGSVEDINARREELAKEGIVPTLFQLKDVEGTEQKLIYPYAIFYYKGRQVAVNMLENTPGMGQEEKLNNSISLLEYKFANAIQKLKLETKPIIAFTTGHGEAGDLQTKDLVSSLRAYYDFGRFDLDSNYQVPPQIDMLIVAKPKTAFSEQDKFKIDQYVMNGGKVMFLVDRLNATLDSMQMMDEFFVPRDYPTNLEDLLFKYGVRIEPNLVLDLQCSQIPQVIGMQGGNPQIELFDWYYHPVVTPTADHPIVKGLGNINLFFPSRVDTVKTKTRVDKTVLLTTSEYSREQYAPVRLSFDILRYDPDPSKFDRGRLPLAVLLEGEFPSLYENRLSESMQAGLDRIGMEYKSRSVPNRMLVVSDGDLAINTVTNPETRGVLPLGYNRYERRQYANKEFMINAIEYLMDADGVIEARGKELKLRLLDRVRAQEEKAKWQLINILLPLVFLGLFGVAFTYFRKRRYA